jgi:exopolyphosphatase/guanosine-5'-triphosphate,3'-diphosphate pyrophosphatase
MVDEIHSAAEQGAAAARVAAIDVGSNSIRLVVAEVLASGGYRVLDEERENTRLAGAMTKTGRLDPKAADASIHVLRNFLSIANGFGASQVRAIGTSAIRDAEDGPDFCDRVRKELKLSIEVISANEASSGLVDQVYETRLGAVRVAEECGVTGVSSEKRVAKLRDYVDRALKKEMGRPPFVPDMLFGTGGTFTALAAMIMASQGQAGQPMWGFRVTRAQIRHLVADLAKMTLERRCKVQGLSPQRADIIVAGLAIIERIMKVLRVNVVQVHTRGVRDGLLLTMVSDLQRERAASDGTTQRVPGVPATLTSSEERRAAVEEFAKNCSVDLPHARQVSRIAGSLWEQMSAALDLKPEDRELIESAALVANVGYLINFEGHHKHSYHLILNSELPGFERRQLQVLANVARYHRGNAPKRKHEQFSELTAEDQDRVRKLAAILRLALALDRTHQQHVGEVKATVRDDLVRITIQAHGATDVDLWAAARKVDLFEKVFGRSVRFSVRGGDAARRKKRVRASRATERDGS